MPDACRASARDRTPRDPSTWRTRSGCSHVDSRSPVIPRTKTMSVGPVADDLVGDRDITAAGIAHVGHVHSPEYPRSRLDPRCAPHAGGTAPTQPPIRRVTFPNSMSFWLAAVSGSWRRLGSAAADSIPECRLWADFPALCRRRLPETVERDLIGAWQLASIEVCPLAGRPQRLLEARRMIVIGVDVHKQSVTAVAVDEAGRMLDERRSRGRSPLQAAAAAGPAPATPPWQPRARRPDQDGGIGQRTLGVSRRPVSSGGLFQR